MKSSFSLDFIDLKCNPFNDIYVQTFVTEIKKIGKNKNEESTYVNINNNFINLLDKEIKKFEEKHQKPKVINSFNTNDKISFDYKKIIIQFITEKYLIKVI